MACSGIAEHNEARRKGNRHDYQAYVKKELLKQLEESLGEVGNGSYEREIVEKAGYPGSVPRPHQAAYVDQQRREMIRQQQLVEYTAKLPNRFTSTDYKSQW